MHGKTHIKIKLIYLNDDSNRKTTEKTTINGMEYKNISSKAAIVELILEIIHIAHNSLICLHNMEALL
jgi:hypothetical protein